MNEDDDTNTNLNIYIFWILFKHPEKYACVKIYLSTQTMLFSKRIKNHHLYSFFLSKAFMFRFWLSSCPVSKNFITNSNTRLSFGVIKLNFLWQHWLYLWKNLIISALCWSEWSMSRIYAFELQYWWQSQQLEYNSWFCIRDVFD